MAHITIVDTFIFYNELDLLLYRLEVLNDIVDVFILVESAFTFSGKEKPLFYNENKEIFKKYVDKIVHVIVYDVPFKGIKDINFTEWDNEYFQRKCIAVGIQKISSILKAEDVILISDVDEIPDPFTLIKIKKKEISITFHSLEQDFYYYNLNSKIINKWYYAKAITYELLNINGKDCNSVRWLKAPIIGQGGWHLSYFGDATNIQNKIIHFSHQEYNQDEYTNIECIQEKINKQIDLYGRDDNIIEKISVFDNDYLPPLALLRLKKYILT
jgi:beta-1,4-mannosyl-glycoprotein beta-1,4-N-acetylglucosaminyltransferase